MGGNGQTNASKEGEGGGGAPSKVITTSGQPRFVMSRCSRRGEVETAQAREDERFDEEGCVAG
jgi:hypothetical protein